MIPADKQARLRTAYLRGDSQDTAAAYARVSTPTAGTYFRRFRGEGVRREPRRRFIDCPIYTGPDWIGVAAQ